jgi:glycerol uptake facilitator-like aquaporin
VSFKVPCNEENEKGCLSQFKYVSFYQALIGEFVGTFLLLIIACGFGAPDSNGKTQPALNMCLGTGFTVATIVWSFGAASGAHINPAVTLSFFIIGKYNIVRAICYITSQLLGSILGSAAVFYLFYIQKTVVPLESNLTSSPINLNKTLVDPIGLTLLNNNLSPVQGILIETLITFFFVTTVLACVDKKRHDLAGSFPLSIGIAIIVGALLAVCFKFLFIFIINLFFIYCLFKGGFTGASMNPARSFGPALFYHVWDNHYIYWIGPLSGSVIASLLYKLLHFKIKVIS